MVVTVRPAISETWVWHENARLPSIWTMQAPHRPVPQPNLVPVSFSPSRSTHSRGVCGGASVDAGLPLTVNSVVIMLSRLVPVGQADVAPGTDALMVPARTSRQRTWRQRTIVARGRL